MKKLITVFTGFVFLLYGCSKQEATQPVNKTNQNDKATSSDQILVVYFSMPETTNTDNMNDHEENSTVIIDNEVLGNTQYVASIIQQQTNSDSFRLEPVNAYPTDYDTLVEQAKSEQAQKYRPEIIGQIDNIDQYDTIFVGYPNWWSDMPMILYSFFDQYDLSGKTIIPFNTHGGSGFSNTVQTIQEVEPNANVLTNGLSISRDIVQEAQPQVVQWLTDLGFIK